MLDVGITQGSYWKGTQIPYWLYLTLVILPTGLLGLDHLLLRSPLTAVLKLILNVPLFGFWYFYDIAQALGERDLVKKFGIAIPYYGPTGIGAGIFTGTEGLQESPNNIPRPWRFLLYTLTSILFIVFPINKLVLGDYPSAAFQFIMYFIFPLTFIAIAWGFYDTYKILLDTRGVFEKGVARVFPATWLIDNYFNRTALGPGDKLPPEPSDSWMKRFFAALIEAPITTIKAYTSGVKVVRDTTIGVAEKAKDATIKAVEVAKDATIGIAKATTDATIGIASAATNTVKGVIKETGENVAEVAKDSLGVVDTAIKASSGVIEQGGLAVEKVVSLGAKVPTIIEKVGTDLSDPNALIQAAKAAAPMAGGFQGEPSISSTVVLFIVVLLAFGGYIIHSLRKQDIKSVETKDDSPPDPRTVRSTVKTTKA